VTVYSDNAHRFANRDRRGTADHILNEACREAIGILRIGRRHDDPSAGREALLVLASAQGRAGRLLRQAS
jgi:hypothetical protein